MASESCIVDNPAKIIKFSELSKGMLDLGTSISKLNNTNSNKSYLDATIAKDRFERYTVIDNVRTYLMELREIK